MLYEPLCLLFLYEIPEAVLLVYLYVVRLKSVQKVEVEEAGACALKAYLEQCNAFRDEQEYILKF